MSKQRCQPLFGKKYFFKKSIAKLGFMCYYCDKEVIKMSEQSERLHNAIINSGLTYIELEKKTGIAKSSIQRYATGNTKKIPIDAVKLIADATNSSAAWIMGWENEFSNTAPDFEKYGILPIKTKKFPMLGKIACGEPKYCNEEYETFIEASANIDADFCLEAKGDSMINARIHNGDVVFIKKQPTVENGEIAAVIIDNEATLKRVYYYPDKNKLVLNAENPAYEPFVYTAEELNQIKILGKAVAFQGFVK